MYLVTRSNWSVFSDKIKTNHPSTQINCMSLTVLFMSMKIIFHLLINRCFNEHYWIILAVKTRSMNFVRYSLCKMIIYLKNNGMLLFTPQYSWNTAKIGVKHQSINQSINRMLASMKASLRADIQLHICVVIWTVALRCQRSKPAYRNHCAFKLLVIRCSSPLVTLDARV